MDDFVDSFDSSSSSDDEEEPPPPKRRVYRNHLDPFNEYSNEEFRKRYRLSKDNVNTLENLLQVNPEMYNDAAETAVGGPTILRQWSVSVVNR